MRVYRREHIVHFLCLLLLFIYEKQIENSILMKKSEYIITAPFSQQGGVASFVNNIIPCLKGNPVVFQRGRSSKSINTFKRITNSLYLPFRFLRLLQKVKAQKILINSSLSFELMIRDGLLIRISKMLNRKTVLFIHGFNEGDLKYHNILRWGYFKADRIVVLANEFKKLLVEMGYKSTIEVSLNPIDELFFQNTTAFTINEISNNILFLSRLERAKGIFEALECFHIIKKRHPELVFNVVGDGSIKKEAEQFVIERNIQDVIFHGFRNGDDKINLLFKCGFLLFPSFHKEGLPISVLEAMATGEIILTRPVGGLKDLYSLCNFGSMIESDLPEDFADAFEELYVNSKRCQIIRSNNQKFAKTHFHPSIIAEKIENIFYSI